MTLSVRKEKNIIIFYSKKFRFIISFSLEMILIFVLKLNKTNLMLKVDYVTDKYDSLKFFVLLKDKITGARRH